VIANLDLSLQIWTGAGELLAGLPRAAAGDDKANVRRARDVWQALRKGLPALAQRESVRLDRACSMRRVWPLDRWRAVILGHPLLRSLAATLVWDHIEGAVATHFRPLPDGRYISHDGQPIALPAAGEVRLAHPCELGDDELTAWRTHFEEDDIAQPFAQLDRDVVAVAENEREKTWWRRFEGYVLRANDLQVIAERIGWDAHDPDDDGGDWLWKAFPAAGVEAALQTGYVWSRAGRYVTTPLLRLGFVPLGAVAHRGEPGAADDEQEQSGKAMERRLTRHLIPLGDVPSIVFSEAARDVAAFAAAGGFDPQWRASTDTWTRIDAAHADEIPF
jgi:hypothetical protein